MPQCSAFSCKNKGVHLFPKDTKRRKQWESALRIKNFKASGTARLCAMHFKEEDYFGRSKYTNYEPQAKFLKKTAVPSIFCFTEAKPENPGALERQHRYEKRSQKKPFQESFEADPQPSTSSVTSMDTKAEISLEIGHEEEVNALSNSIEECLSSATKFLSKSTQIDHEYVYGSINRFKDDDKSIKFYTGFESYKKFQLVYSTVSPMVHKIGYYGNNVINLDPEDQFFMTIMKLKQNKCNFELGKFFNVSQSTVSNIFITWVNFIYQLWIRIDIGPSKELIQYYMPRHFQNFDLNLRVILDGTEIKADRGFTIQDMFIDKNVTVEIPAFLKRKSQLPGLTVIKDRELANKSVHIERIIGLTKTYKILTNDLDHSYIPIANKIFFICFMCCSFQECIMKNIK